MTKFARALALWTSTGLLAAALATGLLAQDAVISVTPATLPLADGAKIVIQGVRRYLNPGQSSATETLAAGYLRPAVWRMYPSIPASPHLLAQDAAPTAANVFSVTIVPRPASFSMARFFGPDFQLVLLQASNGRYVGLMDDDELGPNANFVGGAQILLIDRGDPFQIFVTPLAFAQRRNLSTFAWPPVPGLQLLFCRVNDATLWKVYPRPTENPQRAGATILSLAGVTVPTPPPPAAPANGPAGIEVK
jgi:hypothetical protein